MINAELENRNPADKYLKKEFKLDNETQELAAAEDDLNKVSSDV